MSSPRHSPSLLNERSLLRLKHHGSCPWLLVFYKNVCYVVCHLQIVLLGYSIGTAPSVAYAAQHPLNLCGVVLIAPFTSGWRLIFKRHATASPCCLDRFQRFAVIFAVSHPNYVFSKPK